MGQYFFNSPNDYDEKAIRKKWKPDSAQLFNELLSVFQAIIPFKSATIEMEVKDFMEDKQVGFGQVLPGLRLSLTGTMQGPSVFEIAELLGKEETINRINLGIQKFEEVISSSTNN